jgi:hypothetical protein
MGEIMIDYLLMILQACGYEEKYIYDQVLSRALCQ